MKTVVLFSLLGLLGLAGCSSDSSSDGGAGSATTGGAGGEAQAGAGGTAQGGTAQGGTAQGGTAQGGTAQGGAGAGGQVAEESLAAIQKDIFDKSCSFSSCHSAQGASSSGDLLLGKSDTVPTSMVVMGLVNKMSTTSPTLTLVKPGDAEGSFLVAKLAADTSTAKDPFAGTVCSKDCGDPMPQGSPALSAEKIARIRNWINQGAKDN